MIQGELNIENFDKQSTETRFDYIQGPFHKAEITGIDTCVRKQLIVTCSRDKTVSIWNYETC